MEILQVKLAVEFRVGRSDMEVVDRVKCRGKVGWWVGVNGARQGKLGEGAGSWMVMKEKIIVEHSFEAGGLRRQCSCGCWGLLPMEPVEE